MTCCRMSIENSNLERVRELAIREKRTLNQIFRLAVEAYLDRWVPIVQTPALGTVASDRLPVASPEHENAAV